MLKFRKCQTEIRGQRSVTAILFVFYFITLQQSICRKDVNVTILYSNYGNFCGERSSRPIWAISPAWSFKEILLTQIFIYVVLYLEAAEKKKSSAASIRRLFCIELSLLDWINEMWFVGVLGIDSAHSP